MGGAVALYCLWALYQYSSTWTENCFLGEKFFLCFYRTVQWYHFWRADMHMQSVNEYPHDSTKVLKVLLEKVVLLSIKILSGDPPFEKHSLVLSNYTCQVLLNQWMLNGKSHWTTVYEGLSSGLYPFLICKTCWPLQALLSAIESVLDQLLSTLNCFWMTIWKSIWTQEQFFWWSMQVVSS